MMSKEIGEEVDFTCNICGNPNRVAKALLNREKATCSHCRSSVRTRAIIHILSLELFGSSLPLARLPENKNLIGAGLSDWFGFAGALAEKFDYQNTFYHKEPKLDITNVESSRYGSLDFLIASEVFEHVVPPVSQAFENARRLLKPGGVMILTVPYTLKSDGTLEHFPDLHEFELLLDQDPPVLRNRRRDGKIEVFENLRFHGGPGETLEMRIFAVQSLRRQLERAGFSKIKIYDEDFLEYGIHWQVPWSLPWSARP